MKATIKKEKGIYLIRIYNEGKLVDAIAVDNVELIGMGFIMDEKAV